MLQSLRAAQQLDRQVRVRVRVRIKICLAQILGRQPAEDRQTHEDIDRQTKTEGLLTILDWQTDKDLQDENKNIDRTCEGWQKGRCEDPHVGFVWPQ
jgi:hypothetical protein